MKVWDKIINFFLEDVEEEPKKKEAETIEDIVKPLEQKTPVETKPVETVKPQPQPEPEKKPEQQPVKPKKVIDKSEASTFLKVGNQKEEKPQTEIKPKAHRESRTDVYNHQNVISPIFGNQDFSSHRYASNSDQYDEEVRNDSVIGMVFSPINGKNQPVVETNDEVSKEVASMTTTDFIEKVEETKPEEKKEDSVFVDTDYKFKPKMPKLKEVSVKPFEDKPLAQPESEEYTESYENLKLF